MSSHRISLSPSPSLAHARDRSHARSQARTLLILSLGIMLITAVSGCKASAHYRQNQDAVSFFEALHHEIKPGDSKDRVQQLLGPGMVPPDKALVLAATRKLAEQNPTRVPDGVRDSDEFLGYRYGKRSIGFLQFRDGKLVNFSPKDYAGLAD